jgi:hypothetical protein
MYFLQAIFSVALGIYLEVSVGQSYCNSFELFEELPECFLCHFKFPPEICEGSSFSTSSETFVNVHTFGYRLRSVLWWYFYTEIIQGDGNSP